MRRGAEQRKQTLTEFIVETACAEAEKALGDQNVFVLSHEQWTSFVAALDRPARPDPALRKLFSEPTVLEV